MQAGTLRQRLVLQQLAEAQNSRGEPIATPATFATVWAAIEPLQGRELFAAQQVFAEVTTRIRMRYRAGITPKMRATWNGLTFDILAVLNLESANRELELLAVQRGA
jgi:SPP1 family predicted phage head-tail adaptor